MDGIDVRKPEGFYNCKIKEGQKLNLATGTYIYMAGKIVNASIIRPVKKRKIKN